jgi:putative peptidoglycan lipid II flippase
VALALAFDIAYIVGACLAVALLPVPTGSLFDADTRRFMVRLTLACAVAAGVLAFGLAVFGWFGVTIDSPPRALGAVALAGGAGAAAYLVASRVLGMKELSELVHALRR